MLACLSNKIFFGDLYGMELKLQNTLTRQQETVYPENGSNLGFYCCGPTVYGPAHIGNFRTFLAQDAFRRTVEVLGMQITHVRNITDFDDKTIRSSQAEGKSLSEFTEYWRKAFEADAATLNLLPPHVSPSAVAHIKEQIELIAELKEKGLAYVGEDKSVYYRIDAFDGYGKLSQLKFDDRKKNADGRLNSDDEYSKENADDFALWKAWKPEDGPNQWESPWGPGRPGWHIECSAMSMKYLGDSFDMHSGGVDLIFPHHENEIAQSEGATDKPFVRHWFHIAHLRVEGEKMSKSLGNLYTLKDILDKGYSAEELRYTLVCGHYRHPINFTWDSMNAARSAINKLRKFKELVGAKYPETPHSNQFGDFEPVIEALCDDLNVSKALGRLFTIIAQLEKTELTNSIEIKKGFENVLYVLGLTLDSTPSEERDAPQEILDLAEARWQAKQDRDWGRADTLRAEITELGWNVKDRKDGYDLEPLG